MSDYPSIAKPSALRRARVGAFAVQGFPALWTASLAWNVARWMEQIAIGWITFELTNSPFLVALIGFYRSLPLFLLGIFGGVLGDRYDRRVLMAVLQASNVILVGILAALSFAGHLDYIALVLIEIGLGISMAFDWPSRRSLIVDVAGREMLTNAVALDATGQNVSRTVGPIVSGVLLASLPPGVVLGILAIVYLVNGILLWLVPTPATQIAVGGRGVLHNLADGVGQALKDHAIVGVLLITVAMNLFFFPYQQLLPVVAAEVLGTGSAGLGALSAADGLGSFLGTLLIAVRAGNRRNGMYFWLGSIVSGITLVAFSLARAFPLALSLLFVGGFVRASFSAYQSTIILRNSSDKMRGRAMGILTLAIGVGPFGTLEIGALAQAFDTSTAIFWNAVICVLLVAPVGLRLKGLRKA